jgi:hypothetical protein
MHAAVRCRVGRFCRLDLDWTCMAPRSRAHAPRTCAGSSLIAVLSLIKYQPKIRSFLPFIYIFISLKLCSLERCDGVHVIHFYHPSDYLLLRNLNHPRVPYPPDGSRYGRRSLAVVSNKKMAPLRAAARYGWICFVAFRGNTC